MATHILPGRFVWFLLVLILLALFFEVGRMEVWSDNEGQRATPPAEMLRSGDFVVPTINNKDYLAKPPLLYWAIAGVYKLTGVISPLTARLPGLACAMALVLGIYFCMRVDAGEKPARWAALAFLASPYFLERARWAQLDVPLTLAVFLMVIALRNASRTEKTKTAIALALCGGISLGAAILLKGPVPFLFLWAAWIAHLFETGEDRSRALRTAIRWSFIAFALEVVLKMPVLWLTVRFIPDAQKIVAFPYALLLAAGVWTVLSWRQAGRRRRRDIALWGGAIAVGVAVAAPWALAVLATKGWPYVDNLLRGEVVDRTHTATEINSGAPFYYLVRLPLALLPWGLLLPYHASRHQWLHRPSVYRFSVLAGWLSVLVFSLIAGKEFEYILPALPFLMIATGFNLADMAAGRQEFVGDRAGRLWLRAMPALLAMLALGLAIYASIEFRHAILLIEVWAVAGLGTAALIAAVMSRRRLAAILALALLVFVSWLVIHAHEANRDGSPKTLARLTGALVRQGYEVEAAKVTPAFSFYAQAEIPVQWNTDAILEKLRAPEPYYYLTRYKWMAIVASTDIMESSKVVAGPFTKKEFILLGNQPLPEELAR